MCVTRSVTACDTSAMGGVGQWSLHQQIRDERSSHTWTGWRAPCGLWRLGVGIPFLEPSRFDDDVCDSLWAQKERRADVPQQAAGVVLVGTAGVRPCGVPLPRPSCPCARQGAGDARYGMIHRRDP